MVALEDYQKNYKDLANGETINSETNFKIIL
jgi:hypothetical protein